MAGIGVFQRRLLATVSLTLVSAIAAPAFLATSEEEPAIAVEDSSTTVAPPSEPAATLPPRDTLVTQETTQPSSQSGGGPAADPDDDDRDSCLTEFLNAHKRIDEFKDAVLKAFDADQNKSGEIAEPGPDCAGITVRVCVIPDNGDDNGTNLSTTTTSTTSTTTTAAPSDPAEPPTYLGMVKTLLKSINELGDLKPNDGRVTIVESLELSTHECRSE